MCDKLHNLTLTFVFFSYHSEIMWCRNDMLRWVMGFLITRSQISYFQVMLKEVHAYNAHNFKCLWLVGCCCCARSNSGGVVKQDHSDVVTLQFIYTFLFIYGFPPPTTLMLSTSKSSCLQIQCHLLIVIITLEHDDIPHNIFQHFVGVLFLFSLSQLRHWHCKEACSKISCMLHTPMITCDWDITPSIKDSGNTSYIDENDLASLKNL